MFYKTQYTKDYTNKQDPSIEAQENNKYFVYNCVFSNQQNGCIYIDTHFIDFLHSFCLFHDNFNQNYGGSVYLKGNSHIVQHRFCAYNSTISSNQGQFSNTEVIESNNLNYHVECTLTHCNAPESSGGFAIAASYGTGLLSSSNSSQNSCNDGPGYSFLQSNPNATIKYTTIANNTAIYSVAAHFTPGVFFLTNSNIINNEISSSGDSDSSIIYSLSGDNLTIDSCCFFGNKPGPGNLFYLDNSNSGKFIVKDSHIDSFSETGGVESQSIYSNANLLNYVQHFYTYKCLPEGINFFSLTKDLPCTCEFFHDFLSLAGLSFGFFFI